MSKLFILIFTITFLALFCNCKDVKEGNHGLELLQGLRGVLNLVKLLVIIANQIIGVLLKLTVIDT